MEFKITKEQIDKLASLGIQATMKKMFPEAFETDLELNKWYNRENCANTIVFITKKNGCDRYSGYGIADGEWCSDFRVLNKLYPCFPATEEEISAALIAEAKKRGYKKGVTCLFGDAKDKRTISADEIKWDAEWSGKGGLCMGMNVIFTGGTWNEILPTEKTVITHEKALKILAKKLKVSPENIEIE